MQNSNTKFIGSIDKYEDSEAVGYVNIVYYLLEWNLHLLALFLYVYLYENTPTTIWLFLVSNYLCWTLIWKYRITLLPFRYVLIRVSHQLLVKEIVVFVDDWVMMVIHLFILGILLFFTFFCLSGTFAKKCTEHISSFRRFPLRV